MPRPPSFKTSFMMGVLGMSNPGVTGIFFARQDWMKFHLSSAQHVHQHVDAQTTLLEDILRDGGLGPVKHGSDWDLDDVQGGPCRRPPPSHNRSHS